MFAVNLVVMLVCYLMQFKSNLLAYGVSADFVSLPEVSLHGELVSWKDELMYLGICLIAGRYFKYDISWLCRKFCAASNQVLR